MKNPEILHALLDHLTRNIADYVCYQIEAGAQVVQLFDSWAHHLNPSQFATFSLPYAEKVIRHVQQRHPETPLIFHANGGNPLMLPARLTAQQVLQSVCYWPTVQACLQNQPKASVFCFALLCRAHACTCL